MTVSFLLIFTTSMFLLAILAGVVAEDIECNGGSITDMNNEDMNVIVPAGKSCSIERSFVKSVKIEKGKKEEDGSTAADTTTATTFTEITSSTIKKDVKAEDDAGDLNIFGSTIGGDVQVGKRVRLQFGGVIVHGEDFLSSTTENISAEEGSSITIRGSSIIGDIKANKVSGLDLDKAGHDRRTTIGGNVQVVSADAQLFITDSDIGGELKVTDSVGRGILIEGNALVGGAEIKNNEVISISVKFNHFSASNLNVENNDVLTTIAVSNNHGIDELIVKKNEYHGDGMSITRNAPVYKNIKIEGNTGDETLTIQNNCAGETIMVEKNSGKELKCKDNVVGDHDCTFIPPHITSNEKNDFTDYSFDEQCS
jgi:hypothetical protein